MRNLVTAVTLCLLTTAIAQAQDAGLVVESGDEVRAADRAEASVLTGR